MTKQYFVRKRYDTLHYSTVSERYDTLHVLYCTNPGQRAVQLLQCTASLPWGSGQWTPCNALPHCLGAVGSGSPAVHCPTAWGQCPVQLLQCTTSLPWGSGQCNSCNALPHCLCLGAADSATSAMHCLSRKPCGSAGKKSTIRRPVKFMQDSSVVSLGINLAQTFLPLLKNN